MKKLCSATLMLLLVGCITADPVAGTKRQEALKPEAPSQTFSKNVGLESTAPRKFPVETFQEPCKEGEAVGNDTPSVEIGVSRPISNTSNSKIYTGYRCGRGRNPSTPQAEH